ncbi:MAG TPA: hypothetical protein VGT98_10955 [Candidatus Elarobacter sp.]|nr:hypothetical protein [Candidatus Elarobacter sp.]HEV2739666.1 hypothetical protein [Candidatus Elarobacter sp.]
MRIAWAAGIAFAVLIPLAAFAWEQLDRRPAWVTAVVASAESKDVNAALLDERRALAGVLRRIAGRPGLAVDVRAEHVPRVGDGMTFQAERTVVIRSDAEAPLHAAARAVRGVPNVVPGEPRRATHIGDFTLIFVLVAMLLTLATLERSALSDADPFAIDAPLVALDLLGLGFLAAGAVVVERAWNLPLIPFVALAFAPIVVWLVRARARWTGHRVLRPRYAALAWLAGIVVAGWLARWFGAYA